MINMSEKTLHYLIEKILVPTDGSSYSLKAAQYAAKLAKTHKAKVTILHVMQLRFPGVDRPIDVNDIESAVIEVEKIDKIKERAMSVIDKTKKYFVDEKTPFDTVYFSYGNIPEIIVKTAKDEDYDIIIMGHKGQSEIQNLMMGSVAAAVCRRAPCPVLIVR